jgi:hypothetical protein
MKKIFDKIDMVCVLRIGGLFLIAMYLIQAVMNGSKGAGIDDMLLIFIVTLANGLFQPFVLLGLAEGIERLHSKV